MSELTGGYPQSLFVAGVPPAVLNCSICLNVARNPHRCAQEHVFCYTCISTWLTNHYTCPMDRSKLCDNKGCTHNGSNGNCCSLQVFRMANEMLADLIVRCPNYAEVEMHADADANANADGADAVKVKTDSGAAVETGTGTEEEEDSSRSVGSAESSSGALKGVVPLQQVCTWTGKVSDEHTHSLTCPLAVVYCPWKECKYANTTTSSANTEHAQSRLRRHELLAHVASHDLQKCPDCHEEYSNAPSSSSSSSAGTATIPLSQHRKIYCLKRKVPCTNGCGEEEIVFDTMTQHKAVCTYEQVNCPYHSVIGKYTWNLI